MASLLSNISDFLLSIGGASFGSGLVSVALGAVEVMGVASLASSTSPSSTSIAVVSGGTETPSELIMLV